MWYHLFFPSFFPFPLLEYTHISGIFIYSILVYFMFYRSGGSSATSWPLWSTVPRAFRRYTSISIGHVRKEVLNPATIWTLSIVDKHNGTEQQPKRDPIYEGI